MSAYLGIASPASLFVYSLLFVVGLLGALVGIVAFLLSRYGTDPHEYLVTHRRRVRPAGRGGRPRRRHPLPAPDAGR